MDVPKGKVVITTTVTTVQIVSRERVYYDGPEEDRQYWDDEKIVAYESNKSNAEILEGHTEGINNIKNWNPNGNVEQMVSYGTVDVAVEIQ